MCNDKVVYHKHGGDMWIEYNLDWKKWMVRPTANRNSDACSARSAVTEEGILSNKVTKWEEDVGKGKWDASSMVYYNYITNIKLVYHMEFKTYTT